MRDGINAVLVLFGGGLPDGSSGCYPAEQALLNNPELMRTMLNANPQACGQPKHPSNALCCLVCALLVRMQHSSSCLLKLGCAILLAVPAGPADG